MRPAVGALLDAVDRHHDSPRHYRLGRTRSSADLDRSNVGPRRTCSPINRERPVWARLNPELLTQDVFAEAFVSIRHEDCTDNRVAIRLKIPGQSHAGPPKSLHNVDFVMINGQIYWSGDWPSAETPWDSDLQRSVPGGTG